LNCSAATVKRDIKELQRFGFIEVEQRGKQLTNVYHLMFHDVLEYDDDDDVQVSPTQVPQSQSPVVGRPRSCLSYPRQLKAPS